MPMPTHTTIAARSEQPSIDEALARLRAQLDDIDTDLIELITRRRALSRAIQQRRVAAGGPRIQQGREQQILTRYRDQLGPEGSRLALAVLELCRGRA